MYKANKPSNDNAIERHISELKATIMTCLLNDINELFKDIRLLDEDSAIDVLEHLYGEQEKTVKYFKAKMNFNKLTQQENPLWNENSQDS